MRAAALEIGRLLMIAVHAISACDRHEPAAIVADPSASASRLAPAPANAALPRGDDDWCYRKYYDPVPDPIPRPPAPFRLKPYRAVDLALDSSVAARWRKVIGVNLVAEHPPIHCPGAGCPGDGDACWFAVRLSDVRTGSALEIVEVHGVSGAMRYRPSPTDPWIVEAAPID